MSNQPTGANRLISEGMAPRVADAVAEELGGFFDHGNSGASQTVALSDGTVHKITLTAAPCVLTFDGAVGNFASSFTLVLVQDGTGSRTVTWPVSTKWAGGAAPSLSTAAGAVDIFTGFSTDGGTSWYMMLAGKAFA